MWRCVLTMLLAVTAGVCLVVVLLSDGLVFRMLWLAAGLALLAIAVAASWPGAVVVEPRPVTFTFEDSRFVARIKDSGDYLQLEWRGGYPDSEVTWEFSPEDAGEYAFRISSLASRAAALRSGRLAAEMRPFEGE